MSRFTIVCLGLIVASALSLVSAQYRARQLFIDLDTARAAERKLDTEWRTLQLDQTNYSKHSLIESAAESDLRMVRATPGRTQYITLSPASKGVGRGDAPDASGARGEARPEARP